MAESTEVQGNTESTGADAGVYAESTQEVQGGQEGVQTTPDPGVEAATKAALVNKTEPTEPIKYDFKIPEGIQIDQKALDAFIPVMQELKVPPEQAQKFVDIQIEMVKEAQAKHETAVDEARKSWVNSIKEDKELGGEKLEESIHVANQGLDKVATEGFKQLLQQTGLGDHPDVIRVFHKIGKMLGDDDYVGGSPPGGLGKFYENSPDLK